MENDIDNKMPNLSTFQRPTALTIECDHIYLHQKSIELTIKIPAEKIEQFESIVINGIEFKKGQG